jgi:hypothetical protein
MANVEEKLVLLISEVKALQIGQLTITTSVNTLNAWSDGADKFSAGLNKEIESLTSRIKALEAATSAAPPPVPPREEEGRANGHGKRPLPQGADFGFPTPGHTLVKGNFCNPLNDSGGCT